MRSKIKQIEDAQVYPERLAHAKAHGRGFDPRKYWPFVQRLLAAERGGDLTTLHEWVASLDADEQMRQSFRECLTGYTRWRSRHEVSVLDNSSRRAYYLHPRVTVRVDTEADLEVDGLPVRVRFFGKQAGTGTRALRTNKSLLAALYVIDSATRVSRPKGTSAWILDLRGGQLHRAERLPELIDLKVYSKLDEYAGLWRAIEIARREGRGRRTAQLEMSDSSRWLRHTCNTSYTPRGSR